MAQALQPAILDMAVEGVNLPFGTFRQHLPSGPVIVAFIRHFGCIFCREGVTGLRKAAESDPGYPPVLFVFRGKALDGEKFFAEFWPGAKAVADPTGELYDLFDITSATFGQLFGLASMGAAILAFFKGNRGGAVGLDPMRNPGLFVVRGEAILWSHYFRHAGDHPDFTKIPSYF